jgi:hypothetical protein
MEAAGEKPAWSCLMQVQARLPPCAKRTEGGGGYSWPSGQRKPEGVHRTTSVAK